MNGVARISGKRLVLIGGLVLILTAASARLFAVFYLHDMEHPMPASTQPAVPVAGGP
jgi:hypothetical protein